MWMWRSDEMRKDFLHLREREKLKNLNECAFDRTNLHSNSQRKWVKVNRRPRKPGILKAAWIKAWSCQYRDRIRRLKVSKLRQWQRRRWVSRAISLPISLRISERFRRAGVREALKTSRTKIISCPLRDPSATCVSEHSQSLLVSKNRT